MTIIGPFRACPRAKPHIKSKGAGRIRLRTVVQHLSRRALDAYQGRRVAMMAPVLPGGVAYINPTLERANRDIDKVFLIEPRLMYPGVKR